MRLVIQRVKRAKVLADKKTVGSIGKGLFILVGVRESDTESDALILAEKISKLRLMADEAGKMNLSTVDTDTPLLVVSQFTLYADSSKGNRPSFVKAAEPQKAKKLIELFINELKKKNIKVETGSFGNYMEIQTKLDGPVTILLDSKEKK